MSWLFAFSTNWHIKTTLATEVHASKEMHVQHSINNSNNSDMKRSVCLLIWSTKNIIYNNKIKQNKKNPESSS